MNIILVVHAFSRLREHLEYGSLHQDGLLSDI